ncbi:MAG: ATP synthase F1 subunit epsilon [Rhodospirillales bacterium RIFCSPLOWO2_12_FULL_67_15]|nr:MAG: ATP synthase F1 subunit epsilon [Rhodospirillales bacterium RIFCSPLOWO2_12_FULL_67_15]
MPDTISFDLVTPERLVKSEPVEMVVVPGTEGDMGVLPGHALLIGMVRPGLVVIFEGGRAVERLFVAGGLVDISPERCTVLAVEARPLAEIGRPEAEARLARAREALSDATTEAAKAVAERRIYVAETLLSLLDRAPR